MEYLPGVDLVVVNYRTPEDLQAFCTSIVQYPPSRPWTLTVVNVCPLEADVGVGDWAVAELAACHLCFEENVGYGRGCNAGVLKGRYATLGLFNADVVLEAHAIERCCRALDKHTTWGVVGPRQIDQYGRLTHAGIVGTQQHPRHRAWLRPDSEVYVDILDVPTVSGAAYFISRTLWDDLTACPLFRQVAPDAEGAFLPTSHYWNETYTSYHVRAHGRKVVYYGPVRIIHKWHRASPVGGRVDINAGRDREYFRQACDTHSMEHD